MKILRARYFLMDSKTKVPPLWPQMMSKLYIKTPNNDLLKGHKKSIITITNHSCHLVTDIFFRQSYPKRCKIRVNIRSISWLKLSGITKKILKYLLSCACQQSSAWISRSLTQKYPRSAKIRSLTCIIVEFLLLQVSSNVTHDIWWTYIISWSVSLPFNSCPHIRCK